MMAMLLQNFDFKLDNPAYSLKIKSNLTIKPDEFFMKASLREGIGGVSGLQERLSNSTGKLLHDTQCFMFTKYSSGETKSSNSSAETAQPPPNTQANGSSKKMTILYGSNTGTCQAFAQKLASDAYSRGFDARVADMDSGTNGLPSNEPVVIITSSYEGLPPDNAAQFVSWLNSMKGGTPLSGVQYAVFGCGHKDWSSTFYRVPILVDTKLEELGAKKLIERGSSDASQGDMFSDFDGWVEEKFWPAATAEFGVTSQSTRPVKKGLDMEITTSARASQLQQNVQSGKVLRTYILTAAREPEKRHLDIELPEDMSYEAGDYLSVLPLNPEESIRRVLIRFSIPRDAMITIKNGGPVNLPTNKPLSVFDLLKGLVELSQPARKKVSFS